MQQALSIIPTAELEAMRQDVRDIKAILIALQPTHAEPHPKEPCTVEWIEQRCDVGAKHIKNKINKLKIPKLRNSPVTIEYRYIKELKLKNFKA